MIKRVSNPSEKKFVKQATFFNWDVNRRGWPDYWCLKDGRLIVVEVKPYPNYHLKPFQDLMLRTLHKYGISVYRWSPFSGFETLDDSKWQSVGNPLI